MKGTALKFPDIVSLRHFAELLKNQSYEIHEARLILVCTCREAELALAITKFQAEVIEDLENLAW
ncbi:MAG: hypothetical protein ACO1OO_00415 [Flavisolibacter sp.]